MKTKKPIWPLACCASLLSSCASMDGALSESWRIKSVYSVNNQTETPEALYQLGRYYQGQQRYAQAATAYRRALQASNNSLVDAHNGLGVVYASLGRHDEAIAAFKAAISHAPDSAYLYNNLGHAFFLQGAYPDAVSALEQALILAPDNPRALQNLRLAHAQQEKTAPAPENRLASGPDSPLLAPIASQATQIALEQEPIETSNTPSESVAKVGLYTTIPTASVNTRLETVQIASNIYELRERVSPVKIALAQTPPLPVPLPAPRNMQPLRLEISNGNGVNGFAKKMSGILKEQGFKPVRITNQKPFQVTVSQIQYRPEFKDAAYALQSTLPGNLKLVPSTTLRADVQVRLLLGKDMPQLIAQPDASEKIMLVSRNNYGSPENGDTIK